MDTDKAINCASVTEDVPGLFYNFLGGVTAAESAVNRLFLKLAFLVNMNPLEKGWGRRRGPGGWLPKSYILYFRVRDSI